MKILLLGEYSNVHWTLAEGLRALGHKVCVVSNGDNWKNYKRDISLKRNPSKKADAIKYLLCLLKILPRLKNYDVVQIINPVFIDLKAERILPFYKYIRRHNKKLFMGAFGMDYYWVKTGLDCKTFKYSDFNIGDQTRDSIPNRIFISEWLHGEKGKLNKFIAKDCDGIITGLYEYDACYRPYFPEKTQFIPFPINMSKITPKVSHKDEKIRFFIGVQKTRSEYKGTDIMLKALERLKKIYPCKCEIIKVESVPFPEYQNLMNSSDALLDQLYSYTPGMNGLLAMAKGLILIGGGEEENYEILNENKLRPIINILPDENDIYNKLEELVLHQERLPKLSEQSVEYMKKHHDHIKVAKQYIDFWNSH